MAGPLLSAPLSAPEEDVEEFIGNVDEVHRLIEGLKAGTISPDYIDSKTKLKQQKEEEKKKRSAKESEGRGPAPAEQSATEKATPAKDEGEDDAEDERKERAMAKVKELIANRERKLRARMMYEEYVRTKDQSRFGTDYTKWDIWCPEDEEDDLINSIGPNTAQFKAMEKDIDERHRQLVERRQLAERARVAGNAAYGARQYGEALRCYQQGLESERTNMALHANAAMAALKINCFVQAIEHADKVLSIADFFNNNKHDPLCVKALQRRAEAYRALQQTGRAVQDLQAALELDPKNGEVAKQLARARLEDEEARKQRAVAKAVAKGAAAAPGGEAGSGSGTVEAGGMALDLGKLGRVEKLAAALAPPAPPAAPAAAAGEGATSASNNGSSSSGSSSSSSNGAAPAGGPGAGAGEASARRGPTLPPRPAGKGGAVAGAADAAAAAANGAHAASTSGSGPSEKAAGLGSLAATCEELRGLLRGDDGCCVYLRECGGLQSLAMRITKAAPSAVSTSGTSTGGATAAGSGSGSGGDLAALLLALNDACMNDGNLKQLPPLKVLPAVVACLDGAGEEAAAAAVALLCTAVTNEDVRKEVSVLLGAGGAGGGGGGGGGKGGGAAAAGKKDAGVDGLGRLLRVLTSAQPAVQGVALALLGNCMVDKPTKAAMTAAWRAEAPAAAAAASSSTPSSTSSACSSSGSGASGAFLSLLRSPVGVLAEKAAVLLGNMATDPGLRAEMLSRHGSELVGQLLAMTAPPPTTATTAALKQKQKAGAAAAATGGPAAPPDADARRAAATALFNLTIEEAGQRLVAEDGEGLGRLYGMVSATAADRTLAARAAGVVARAARVPAGAAALLQLGAVEGMVGVAVAALDALEGSSSSSGGDAAAAAEREPTLAVLDAAVRTVTILTTPEDAALTDRLLAAAGGGVAALLRVIRAASAGGSLARGSGDSAKGAVESVLGNAVLCLAGVARRGELLPALRAADPVPPLIQVAYDGKGNAASKNAAICLARLARDAPMLERLRELHGIEIIYQYVKPT
ncbi:hypothetical protein HYH02_000265 [Chlamydomonas schloesseri]|uniref:Protein unc-45 homolog B n=1 Tax=Chlamydomonas schloesseri TaxID=2026947 RepID=A0A835WLV6_9CHLO|nr:hypothetical protein HYH02_000265 [Chlamydomonas schloesseri]|eukprot:KAG2450163.1 hypothetical protein HYH02_000265 [Chlamydomonas schloesseri]